MTITLQQWVLEQLEAVKQNNPVLVKDSLRLSFGFTGVIHNFAKDNNFTVIIAATNLVFRDLYNKYSQGKTPSTKLLVIDQSVRKYGQNIKRAPPVFYPDLLESLAEESKIELNLREYLKECTDDKDWPAITNEPIYARLILKNLNGILRAHQSLRNADKARFTDEDFYKIIVYGALGVGDLAFKLPDADDYWKIGLLGHEAFEELESAVPDITSSVKKELTRAPVPFCHFADKDPEKVIQAFYLSLILSQYSDEWNLLLNSVDPTLASLTKGAKKEILWASAPKLIEKDSLRAGQDLLAAENAISTQALQEILVDRLKINSLTGFTAILEKERYSSLFRSLAMVLAIEDALLPQPSLKAQTQVSAVIFEAKKGDQNFLDISPSESWSALKEIYRLIQEITRLRDETSKSLKTLKVTAKAQLDFNFFFDLWNLKKVNRLEYYLSMLDRLVSNQDLLPREDIPVVFINAIKRIRQRINVITDEVNTQLDEINRYFQDLVISKYPSIITSGKVSESVKTGLQSALPILQTPVLTSQFLQRCLKPNWDPQKEKAVILVFDGMRYEIWDEILRPALESKLEMLVDIPALSLLPSETHISRKAISAGLYPDEFDMTGAEHQLLKSALKRVLGLNLEIQTIPPTGGTGERFHFRAGNLDFYVFDLCDEVLHNIQLIEIEGGRKAPARNLAFLYQQHIKNIIDTEITTIIRKLAPDTKVFIVADHGFGRIGRQPVLLDEKDLNEPEDCKYLNCYLKYPFAIANISQNNRSNILALTPEQIRMPREQNIPENRGRPGINKKFAAVLFPRTGYAFRRPNSPFKPDAYSHGGISMQEMLIPMAVMCVKSPDKGILALEPLNFRKELIEGEEVEFTFRISLPAQKKKPAETRVDIDASWNKGDEEHPLAHQVRYVAANPEDISYPFRADSSLIKDDERIKGTVEFTLTINIRYSASGRQYTDTIRQQFKVQPNPDKVIRRIPSSLGKILGAMPRDMR